MVMLKLCKNAVTIKKLELMCIVKVSFVNRAYGTKRAVKLNGEKAHDVLFGYLKARNLCKSGP